MTLTRVQKEYSNAFLLEPTKLTRLVEVIHERLEDNGARTIDDRFEVFLPKNRIEVLTNLEDEVLKLENSAKQRIQRLKITSAGTGRVIVDFGVVKAPINSAPNATPRKVISVIIVGENPKWNARTLAEVEEQIERTRLRNTAPILALTGLVVLMLVAFLLQVGVVKSQQDLSAVMWLDKESLDRVETIVSQNRPITEEEQREINTIQLRTLVKSQKAQEPPKGRGRKLTLMGLPTLALVICSAVLGFTCYPSAVFLWGDETDRYASLINRRKILWGVIISLIVVGVLSKFLYEAIALWLPSAG